MANQASLDDLNARLRQGRGRGADGPVPAQYRGAGDWEAFEEDHTALIEAAEVRMAFVKPCTRCSIPDIDQRSAQQFDEPGRTLASYRNLEIGVVLARTPSWTRRRRRA